MVKKVSDAINMAYPSANLQLCIVQMVCYSMKCVPQIDKKAVVPDLEAICGADKFEIAKASLNHLKVWGKVSTHRWLSLGVITGSA